MLPGSISVVLGPLLCIATTGQKPYCCTGLAPAMTSHPRKEKEKPEKQHQRQQGLLLVRLNLQRYSRFFAFPDVQTDT